MTIDELLVVLKSMKDTAWGVRRVFEEDGNKKMAEHYSAVCGILWEIVRMIENEDFAKEIQNIYVGNN